MLDALLFVVLTAGLYRVLGFLLTIPLKRYLVARQLRHFREPVRQFGTQKSRPLFRALEETGRAPPKLEPLLAELEERG
jgi:hypothetical protein